MRGSCGAVTDGHARLAFLEDYFFIRSSTAAVIATMPVRIVGSGTGANLLECRVGSGAVPGFFDSANFAGSTAPTWKLTAGIECSGRRLYSEKSSPPMVASTISTFGSPSVFFQAATSCLVSSGLLYIAGAK